MRRTWFASVALVEAGPLWIVNQIVGRAWFGLVVLVEAGFAATVVGFVEGLLVVTCRSL